MLKKVILCPNPYRDHELTVAKEAKRILDSVHCPNVVCVPFRNEEKPEGYGLDIRPLQQELRGADHDHRLRRRRHRSCTFPRPRRTATFRCSA